MGMLKVYLKIKLFNSFLRNLLLGENNLLENRNLHVSASKVETSRELKILIIITENPSITIDKLSKDTGCSIRTIKNVLKVLETNKKIKESMANVMAVGKFINNDLKKEIIPFSL